MPRGKPLPLTKEILYQENHINNLTPQKIAEKYNLNYDTVRKLFKRFDIERKPICDKCGTTEDICTQDRKGKLQKYNLCLSCLSKIRRETCPSSEEQKQKIKKYWQNASKEKTEERSKKQKETLKNVPIEIQQQRNKGRAKKIKERNLTPEYKEKLSKNKKLWWKNLTKEKQENYAKEWTKLRMEKFYSLPIEIQKQKTKERTEKANETKRNWTTEQKKEFGGKISEGNLKRFLKYKEEGTFSSQEEKNCFEYIKQNIDPKVQTQIKYSKWIIDFYLPKYGQYLQMDGRFWHGIGIEKEKILKYGKLGESILKTIEKDKKQNETIPNLVRINDDEFRKNPELIMERIKNKMKEFAA